MTHGVQIKEICEFLNPAQTAPMGHILDANSSHPERQTAVDPPQEGCATITRSRHGHQTDKAARAAQQ